MAKKKSSAGRKPVDPEEKVILVGFYIKRKFVERVGGMDRARKIAAHEVEHHANG